MLPGVRVTLPGRDSWGRGDKGPGALLEPGGPDGGASLSAGRYPDGGFLELRVMSRTPGLRDSTAGSSPEEWQLPRK